MKIAIILNRSSGTDHSSKNSAKEQIEQKLQAAGMEVDLHVCEGAAIRNAAEESVRNGAQIIVAGGGDGTISAVASVLCGTDIPLGVLPLGTLNHFAKDLKIPADLSAALQVILRQNIKKIDVAQVNGHKFINNSSIGVYPWMVKQRSRAQKDLKLSKWSAMVGAWILCLKRFPLERVRIFLPEQIITTHTPFVFVGNNKYQMNLPELGTRESLDQGELSVFLLKHSGRSGLLRLGFAALMGHLSSDKNFKSFTLKDFVIELRKAEVSVSVDGEVIALAPPLKYSILTKSLNVILP